MSLSLASVTNQRLDAARTLLQQSQQQSDRDWMVSSFESSAVFQLRSALNGLCQEVKAAYHLPSGLRVSELVHQSQQEGFTIPVLQELSALEQDRQSWLNQLYNTYQVAFECQPSALGYSTDSNELIGRGSDQGASTKYILDSLVELVLRFREDAAEY